MARFVMSQPRFVTPGSVKEKNAASTVQDPENTVLELPPGQKDNTVYQSMYPQYEESLELDDFFQKNIMKIIFCQKKHFQCLQNKKPAWT
ncbi:unnamed protein product [Pneumocystis jirovecii]|uniref:Uncharacterized protein n=1 Tax=Pneumocystis jirovecii TaxID=42068 RepID=L0P7L5_PNEJI|nr:unnamed protein product [Pneumocystis jirovecii]